LKGRPSKDFGATNLNGQFTKQSMLIIIILIVISLAIALLFLGLFLWSMKSGQYEDTYTPSVRMLFDNEKEKTRKNKKKHLTSPGKLLGR